MAFTIYNQGSFLSTGVAKNIPVPSGADYFRVTNLTQMATTQATGRGVIFEWFSNPSFVTGGALEIKKTNNTDVLNGVMVATGGFTYVTAPPPPEAAYVGTDISNATPAVASGFGALPYVDGDNVVLYGTTGMLQIGGCVFTISTNIGTGFTLLGLAAAGFAAPATAVTARRVSPYAPVLPEFFYVSAISQAANAVVTVTQDPTRSVYVGQKLVFQIPSSFGMTEINGIQATVVAVNYGAYQFTINVNTTAFTAFAWPASTTSPTGPLFATVAPAGCTTQYSPALQTYTGYDFNKQPFRSSQFYPYMHLAAGAQSPAGSTGDTIVWEVGKMEAPEYIVV
jgi:hypothetical protein